LIGIYTIYENLSLKTFRKKLIRIFLGDRIREGDWGKFGMGEN
jgi:hypothetical protein